MGSNSFDWELKRVAAEMAADVRAENKYAEKLKTMTDGEVMRDIALHLFTLQRK